MDRLKLTLVVTIALASSLTAAETYTVRADGSGDFRGLQEALDETEEGATLIISGVLDSDRAAVIRHSVRLLGEQSAAGAPPVDTIRGGDLSWEGIDGPTAAIVIDADDTDVVTFRNLQIIGHHRNYAEYGSDGVVVRRAGDVYFDNCLVVGGSVWASVCGTATRAGHGFATDGPMRILSSTASTFEGGFGAQQEANDSCPWLAGIDGGSGIVATGALEVHLYDTFGRGNHGSRILYWGFEEPTTMRAGDGGHGFVGDAFVDEDLELLSGHSRSVRWVFEDWGDGFRGNNGSTLIGAVTPVGDRLTVLGHSSIASPEIVIAIQDMTPFREALVLGQFELALSRLHGGVEWFLNSTFEVARLPLDATGSARSLAANPVFREPALIGVPIVMQAIDGPLISNPVITVITD